MTDTESRPQQLYASGHTNFSLPAFPARCAPLARQRPHPLSLVRTESPSGVNTEGRPLQTKCAAFPAAAPMLGWPIRSDRNRSAVGIAAASGRAAVNAGRAMPGRRSSGWTNRRARTADGQAAGEPGPVAQCPLRAMGSGPDARVAAAELEEASNAASNPVMNSNPATLPDTVTAVSSLSEA